MICYANFVKHSEIGDEFYPVLKIIPINRGEEEDKYVTEHFENLEYLMCNTTRLDLLHFQLKRLDGELINFETNEKIMINLAIQNLKQMNRTIFLDHDRAKKLNCIFRE